MTDDEAEKRAKAEYDAGPLPDGHVRMPWAALPEFRREHWRRFVRAIGPHPKHLPRD